MYFPRLKYSSNRLKRTTECKQLFFLFFFHKIHLCINIRRNAVGASVEDTVLTPKRG